MDFEGPTPLGPLSPKDHTDQPYSHTGLVQPRACTQNERTQISKLTSVQRDGRDYISGAFNVFG